MELTFKIFSELTREELYEILKARINVFVVEQNCPYKECDDFDQVSYHCFAWAKKDGDKEVIAYARIIPPGEEFKEAAFGRVLTSHRVRGTGLGHELMEGVMEYTKVTLGFRSIRIKAQKYLEDFYLKFGFKSVSATFLLDGIEHIEMLYED